MKRTHLALFLVANAFLLQPSFLLAEQGQSDSPKEKPIEGGTDEQPKFSNEESGWRPLVKQMTVDNLRVFRITKMYADFRSYRADGKNPKFDKDVFSRIMKSKNTWKLSKKELRVNMSFNWRLLADVALLKDNTQFAFRLGKIGYGKKMQFAGYVDHNNKRYYFIVGETLMQFDKRVFSDPLYRVNEGD